MWKFGGGVPATMEPLKVGGSPLVMNCSISFDLAPQSRARMDGPLKVKGKETVLFGK